MKPVITFPSVGNTKFNFPGADQAHAWIAANSEPTAEHVARLAAIESEIATWQDRANRVDWDGFSMVEWAADGAIGDLRAERRLCEQGGLSVFCVLVDEAGEVVQTRPVFVTNEYSHARELKWEVRINAQGWVKHVTYNAKRATTLGKFGLLEVWAVLPARVGKNTTTMKEASRGMLSNHGGKVVPFLKAA